AQRDREQAERDSQARQKEWDDWWKQRDQKQKEWDDWWNQREKSQKEWDDWWNQRGYGASSAYPGYPYSGLSAAEKAAIPLPKPRAQVGFVPATPQRRTIPLNAMALQQLVRQNQERARQQIMQARRQMLPGPQAAPQLIINPFVATAGRQEPDQQI